MSNIFAGLEDLGFKMLKSRCVSGKRQREEKAGSGKTGCKKRNKRRRPRFLTRATPVRYATMNLRAVW